MVERQDGPALQRDLLLTVDAGAIRQGQVASALGLFKHKLVILERFPFIERAGKTGMPANTERHPLFRFVFDQKGGGKTVLSDRVGHVEQELERILPERFRIGRVNQLDKIRTMPARLKRYLAGEPMLAQRVRNTVDLEGVVEGGAANWEQHGGVVGPDRRVCLPDVLPAVLGDERDQLRPRRFNHRGCTFVRKPIFCHEKPSFFY